VMTTNDALGGQAEPPAAGDRTADQSGTPASASEPLLGLTVQHPAVGVCAVTVDGELDMVTAPLLEACLREQLATDPTHLIVDLQPVGFMASNGLNCLIRIHELAQITGAQLHLAGLVTRAVARPLQVTQLLEVFNTYPTLAHALSALTG
jgi:anti-sigma B factor antagonist